MSVVVPTKSSSHFSISTIVSRFRSKKRTPKAKPISQTLQDQQKDEVQDLRAPLEPVLLPLVLPEHQQTLSNLGWTTITFPSASPPNSSIPLDGAVDAPPSQHPLQDAYKALFEASQTFFAQPTEEKTPWKTRHGSEEGWSRIPGEKEFITLRSLEFCPEVLREPAARYWGLMGAQLDSTLGQISKSLTLPEGEEEGLRRFVGPCKNMPENEAGRTATMLRLFRYENDRAADKAATPTPNPPSGPSKSPSKSLFKAKDKKSEKEDAPKVVAEAHADLGLLSVVVGDVPGLEVWDGNDWFDVERDVLRNGRQGASLLVGRQLERLSNNRYPAGGHRVVAYADADTDASKSTGAPPLSDTTPTQHIESKSKYRFSIVLVLRAHESVVIDSTELTTPVTGEWNKALRGVTAGEFYEDIRMRHYNINVEVTEREKQRRKMAGLTGMKGMG